LLFAKNTQHIIVNGAVSAKAQGQATISTAENIKCGVGINNKSNIQMQKSNCEQGRKIPTDGICNCFMSTSFENIIAS
jgi:hypothetical protein